MSHHGIANHTEQAPPQSHPSGPPYPPRTATPGGLPDLIPDVPVSAAFLCLYTIFAATHMTILQANNARGHKFLFSGALFGFCMIRVVTMSLRIAWAFNQQNIELGVTAQIFVYVGTVILFLINWFFTQRIIRAQHPTWGWSQLYRILHRLALGLLIALLVLLLIAAIQQVFTLDANTHRIDRILQLTGQTYFAVFCMGPVFLTVISFLLPRKETEKFGAGRLRVNIAILFCSAIILAAGAIFRCVTAWEPAVPLRNAHGQPVPRPWYLSKVCFYTFNFATEILVVIAYAITRVDLRFHVPDGSKVPGMYREGRNSKYNDTASTIHEKVQPGKSHPPSTIGDPPSEYTETASIGADSMLDEETRTLVDSYRYPSSVLEVDQRTGTWKIKTHSRPGSINSRMSQSQRLSWNTYQADSDAPPLPSSTPNWPLPPAQPIDSAPVLEHKNRRSMPGSGANSPVLGGSVEDEKAELKSAIRYAADRMSGERASDPTLRKKNSYKSTSDSIQRASSLRKKHSYTCQKPPSFSNLRESFSNKRRSLQQDSSSSHYSSTSDLKKEKSGEGLRPGQRNDEDEERATPEEILKQSLKEINEAVAKAKGDIDHEGAEEEWERFDYVAPPRRGEYGYRGGDEEERGREEGRER